MVFIEPVGGLCNRMRTIASALQVAEIRKDNLTVLWQLDQGLNCKFENLFESIPGVIIITFRRYSIKKYVVMQKYRSKSRIYTDIKDMAILRKEEAPNLYIKTPHQFMKDIEFDSFVPHIEFENAAKKVLGGCSKIIGIHIRRTDNVKSIINSPTEQFIDEIQKRIQEDSDVRFFLATDSEAEEKEILTQFGNKILVQKGKDLSRNSTTGIQNALVDLLCLSYCDEIWGSYWSSFSETAAAWHGKKNLRIISLKG